MTSEQLVHQHAKFMQPRNPLRHNVLKKSRQTKRVLPVAAAASSVPQHQINEPDSLKEQKEYHRTYRKARSQREWAKKNLKSESAQTCKTADEFLALLRQYSENEDCDITFRVEFCAKNASYLLDLKDIRINHAIKETILHRKNESGWASQFTFDKPLITDGSKAEIKIAVCGEVLFVVKRTKQPGKKGHGLFAAKNFSKNQLVGMYCGHPCITRSTLDHKEKSKYMVVRLEKDGASYYCNRNDRYLGMHHVKVNTEQANVRIIFPSLLVETTRAISTGEELVFRPDPNIVVKKDFKGQSEESILSP